MFLSVHHDADGVSSGVLFFLANGLELGRSEVEVPDEFGDVNFDVDVVIDQVPPTDFGGVVYDHHPDHPSKDKRSYELVHGHVPSAVMIFREFIEDISREQYWKTVVGAVGDAQPETIPADVWKASPELLSEEGYWNKKANNWRGEIQTMPVYKRLSSFINAGCKTGNSLMSFRKLYNADNPFDILRDDKLIKRKIEVSKGTNSAMKNGDAYRNGFIQYFVHESDLRINGNIAGKISGGDDFDTETVVVRNAKDNSVSFRGDKVNLIKDMFEGDSCVDIGGHNIAAGGTVRNVDEFEGKLLNIGFE